MKNLLLVLIGFLMINSCTQDLGEQTFSNVSSGDFTFKTSDFPKAIGPVYSNLRSVVAGFDTYALQEVGTDEMAQPANASGWSDGGIYYRIETHTWTSQTRQVLTLWNSLYHGALHANRIIAQINDGKVKVPNGTTKKAALAEMRTARAFYYWLIMDDFGSVPLVIKPKSESENFPAATSRKEIYQFVVKELTESIPDLSESAGQDMYGRFNKWAAKTVLAAVYLNAKVYTGQAEWNKCLQQVNDVINSGRYQLDPDYKDPFKVQNENSSAMVLAVPFDANNAQGFNFEQQISFYSALKDKFQMKAQPYGAGSLKMVPQFGAVYDSLHDKRYSKTWLMGLQLSYKGDTLQNGYEEGPVDFTRNYKDGLYTNAVAGFRIGKWEIEKGATGSLNNDFPFFRYARVLLMKAECLLRMGNASQAATVVTKVRMRDFEDPGQATVTAADLTKNSAINYGYWQNFKVEDQGDTSPVKYGGFLDELGREFACERFRRRDMIRFGIYEKKSYLAHKPLGDYRTVFPIPLSVVEANPNLEQDPNYK